MKRFACLLILIMPFVACTQKENNESEKAEDKGKKTEAYNEQRMREFYDQVMNAHNPAMMDSFCTADYTEHSPFPGQPSTIEGTKKGFTDWVTAFPDMKATVQMVKAWGDTCMAKVRITGTNTGMFMGAPASGKSMDIEATGLYAVCIQHEMDHLIGKVFLDRMTDMSTLTQLHEFGRYWQHDPTPAI